MKKKDLRIVFMGTPEFAVESLKALVENGYNVVSVVTQPDKPVGRHHETPQASAVKQYALDIGLPVLQPERMKDEKFLAQLRALKADLQVVVAFRMLPREVWSMPTYKTFNVHAALLPDYRGAAPINWAVINGETETGVTTFFLDEDIDTGRIIQQKKFPIPDDANVEYVYNGLMHLGAKVAMETVDLIATAQSFEEISYQQINNGNLHTAPKLFKENCLINWNQPAKRIYNFIRGLSPMPGAWTSLPGSLTLKIYKSAKTSRSSTGTPGTFVVERNKLYANTEDFQLELLEIQLSGKKRMMADSFLNGFHDRFPW